MFYARGSESDVKDKVDVHQWRRARTAIVAAALAALLTGCGIFGCAGGATNGAAAGGCAAGLRF
jgi:hypothetical protein